MVQLWPVTVKTRPAEVSRVHCAIDQGARSSVAASSLGAAEHAIGDSHMRRFFAASVPTVLAGGLVVALMAPGVVSQAQTPPTTPPWSVTNSPSTTADVSLSAVSCQGLTSCMAVGDYYPPEQAMSESWNGTSWAIVSTPTARDSSLSAVSCTSSTNCVAVGAWAPTPGFLQTLTESWNGTQWTLVASPDGTTTDDNVLNGVSCVSADSCLAVGYYGDSSAINQTLIEQWNGVSWSIIASADESTEEDEDLTSVKCLSATSCLAVGLYLAGSDLSQNLVEAWNGTAWSIVDSPDVGTDADNELNHVTCTAPTSCTAVGDYYNASDIDQALIESWNGTKWSVVPSPSEQASNNALESVGCVSSASCVAVGFYENGALAQQTLIESWNGSAWSLVLSPNESNASDQLGGVAHIGKTKWVAVGGYVLGDSQTQALVETAVPIASSTAVISVTAKAVAGESISMRVKVTSSEGAFTPTGQVTISLGSRRCSALLSGSKGSATATCSVVELAAGTYPLVAAYPGDAAFLPSATSTVTSVTVGRAPSTTGLSLSQAKITRGDEETEHLSVVVSPKFPGVTTDGEVTITASTKKVCVVKVASGKASCTLASSQLAAGTYRIVAAFGGDASLLSSASVGQTLTVAK
jgi:hypothetical protein